MMRGFRELNLTDAQKEQIHTILEANKPDKSQFESLRPLMEAKRNGTITAEQTDQLDAFKAADASKTPKESKQQILAVLTAEQHAQLEKQKQEWKQKRQERKQMRQERKNKQTTQTDKKR